METLQPIGSALQSILSNLPGSLSWDEQPTAEEFEQIRVNRYNAAEGDLSAEDGYSCSECKNKGKIAFLRNGNFTIRNCKCLAARRSKRILRRSGLEALISRCKFSTYEQRYDWQRQAYQVAKGYADRPQGWLVLSGRSGTGKTHLCTAVCRELMLRGIPVRYMLWRDEVAGIKFGDPSDRQERLQELQRIDCLYIDDFLKVGKNEKPTQADMSIAFELLNHRYNNPNLLTIISTELTAAEIIDLDEATGSRIYEKTKGGRFLQFAKTAQNWRLIE